MICANFKLWKLLQILIYLLVTNCAALTPRLGPRTKGVSTPQSLNEVRTYTGDFDQLLNYYATPEFRFARTHPQSGTLIN